MSTLVKDKDKPQQTSYFCLFCVCMFQYILFSYYICRYIYIYIYDIFIVIITFLQDMDFKYKAIRTKPVFRNL